MINSKKIQLILTSVLLLLILGSCQMDRSTHMTEEQQRDLEAAYESTQNNYRSLMDRYESSPDSLPGELQSMYTQMQQMHGEMDINHRQMMSMNMGQHMMERDQMMEQDRMMNRGMGTRMQDHMTGEWYQQMRSMHERMAAIHNQQGQQQMAEMNRRLSEEYDNMMHMVPGLDESIETPSNEQGDPAMLNGENLFAQNCASCHGTNGNGLGNAFPPLINSEWITEEKSIPIQILTHGLTGEIEVNGQPYSGTMPSFSARLSAAEMAAILNHLRSVSNEDLPEITQDDVIRIKQTYSDRRSPWTAEELRRN